MTVLPHHLEDGLTLRMVTAADADSLAAFNADVLRSQDMAEPQGNLFPRQPSFVWPVL